MDETIPSGLQLDPQSRVKSTDLSDPQYQISWDLSAQLQHRWIDIVSMAASSVSVGGKSVMRRVGDIGRTVAGVGRRARRGASLSTMLLLTY